MPIAAICPTCDAPFSFRPSKNKKFCSPTCGAIGRRNRTAFICQGCGKEAEGVPSRHSKFCSQACRLKGMAAPIKLCARCEVKPCGPRFTYCSRACYLLSLAGRSPCVCEHCGNPVKKVGRRFCSISCAGLAIRKRHPCATCGQDCPTSQTYCSIKCRHAVRVRSERPKQERQRRPLPSCSYCDRPISGRARRTCGSVECIDAARRKAAATAVATRKPFYAAEIIEEVRNLRQQGVSMRDIGKRLRLNKAKVSGIITRNSIPLGAKPKAEKAPKAKKQSARLRYAAPKPAKSKPPKLRGIPVLLRELYQLGGQLYMDGLIRASQRDDIDAITRAVRKQEPEHPGFVITTIAHRGMTQEWR